MYGSSRSVVCLVDNCDMFVNGEKIPAKLEDIW